IPSGETLPPGTGRRYRLATSGPGVTPDVSWEGDGLGDYDSEDVFDRAHEDRMNELQQLIVSGSDPCRP
ncbi:MAG: hypothetical protein M3435_02225, partial [Actinomycetota bacterium]|nr:hypothetical protein [Actinomycetota bacterium]